MSRADGEGGRSPILIRISTLDDVPGIEALLPGGRCVWCAPPCPAESMYSGRAGRRAGRPCLALPALATLGVRLRQATNVLASLRAARGPQRVRLCVVGPPRTTSMLRGNPLRLRNDLCCKSAEPFVILVSSWPASLTDPMRSLLLAPSAPQAGLGRRPPRRDVLSRTDCLRRSAHGRRGLPGHRTRPGGAHRCAFSPSPSRSRASPTKFAFVLHLTTISPPAVGVADPQRALAWATSSATSHDLRAPACAWLAALLFPLGLPEIPAALLRKAFALDVDLMAIAAVCAPATPARAQAGLYVPQGWEGLATTSE